jgi:Mn-dependent DtxR family transcriptional regulator
LTKFFTEYLGLSKDTAFADACKMEHLMSLDTGKRLLGMMHFLERHPKLFKELTAFLESGQEQCEDVEGCPICANECMAAPEDAKAS